MAGPVNLVMEYDRKVGRWFIKTAGEMKDPPIRFPSEKRVVALWDEHVPSTGILVGSSIAEPVRGFYADTGTSTKAQRQKFLDALTAESAPV